MEVVGGKETLKDLRTEVQRLYNVNLTDYKIIEEFKPTDVPKDLSELLFKLDSFRTSEPSQEAN